MKRLHKIIFWSHLLSGVIAGLVIFIMSFTGVILMYESQITEYVEGGVRRVLPPPGGKRLGYDEMIAKVRAANPQAPLAAMNVQSDPGASVVVSLGRDEIVFVNPYTGQLLGGPSAARHFMRGVVDWHRWLGVEGEGRAAGRAVTGACNLAFFWLAVTGIYLWWPRSWQWRGLKTSVLFNSRLRGKARDWNWHNVIGFWSSIVLVILTLTAVVMSYPWANDLLYTLAGSEPPRRGESPAGPVSQAPRPREGATTPPMASFDVLMARAQERAPGWIMILLRFPQRGDGTVTALIQGPEAFHRFQRSQLTLHRVTGEVVKWEPYAANSTGRKLRTWVRALHTGEAFGFAGQTVAGLASLGACFLVWTGLAMAWRRLRHRKREAGEIPENASEAARAEINAAALPPELQTKDTIEESARIEMEETTFSTGREHAYNGREDAYAEWTAASTDGDPVLILYGTVTGNAELLANRLAAELRSGGMTAHIRDMADCQSSVLRKTGCVLMVVSTYGDGEPPDDAAPFWETVVRGNGLDLRGVKFSVLALGNTTFDHFCKCGRDFDAALERHGATRLYPRVDCDADYDEPAQRWFEGVLTRLQQDGHVVLSD